MGWLSDKKIPVSVVPWLLIALCVVFAGVWFRYSPSRRSIDPVAPATQAPLAKKTANLPTRQMRTSVAVVDKEEVEKRIPGAISLETRANPQRFTFPPAELEPWHGRRIVTPVLDNATGNVFVEDKKLPPPWFEWKKEFTADVRYMFVGDHVFETDVGVIPFRLNSKDGRMSLEPSLFGGLDVRKDDNAIGGRAGIWLHGRF